MGDYCYVSLHPQTYMFIKIRYTHFCCFCCFCCVTGDFVTVSICEAMHQNRAHTMNSECKSKYEVNVKRRFHTVIELIFFPPFLSFSYSLSPVVIGHSPSTPRKCGLCNKGRITKSVTGACSRSRLRNRHSVFETK